MSFKKIIRITRPKACFEVNVIKFYDLLENKFQRLDHQCQN